jgi:hypothetical protein
MFLSDDVAPSIYGKGVECSLYRWTYGIMIMIYLFEVGEGLFFHWLSISNSWLTAPSRLLSVVGDEDYAIDRLRFIFSCCLLVVFVPC